MKVNLQSLSSNYRTAIVAICQTVVVVVAELLLGGFLPAESLSGRLARPLSVLLSFFVLYLVSTKALSGFKTKDVKRLFWMYALLVFSVALLAGGEVLTAALSDYTAKSGVTSGSLVYALPFTTGVLMVQSILGLHYGLVSALMTSILVGVYLPSPTVSFALAFTVSMVASMSLMRVRSRSAYLRAALNIAVASIPFALATVVSGPITSLLDMVVRIGACVVGGCLSSFLAVGLTPVAEYLGGYASDMRLIEMATLDHPLLKELSIQAPGTWNHSMVMGMMVESAADAIGANSVVCRVGAYFHDVGKMKKPLYFVENQAPGENRHDKLSPSMSALIIRSHVKDGVELVRKHKVPQVIEDMIPQHHGTSLIEYFYEKAKKEVEEASEDAESVDKSLYSYPGPRPQTREAGLLMLADGIEAAARTLPDPTFDRIQGMVQKMINKVFSSGELNECELTLRDLHLIAKCFTRVLSGIYHQRIAYAEPAEKVNEGTLDEDSPESGEQHRKPRVEENLKRLGLE